jgi:hypothetical protein
MELRFLADFGQKQCHSSTNDLNKTVDYNPADTSQ